MALEWREQLSVGNDLLDSDHKYLIEIINQAENGLRLRSLSEARGALDSLSRYSVKHFFREEKIAIAVGYSHAAQLHESHEGLLRRLDQVRQELGEEWTDASVEGFGAFLRDWLINHVIKEDMLMKPFLKKFSPRFAPR
jgi:hemerythrin